MLGKPGHIILTLLLLVETMGVVVNKHYSHGHLYDVSLFAEAEECCAVPMPCCEDEVEVYQFRADYEVLTYNPISVAELILPDFLLFEDLIASLDSNLSEFSWDHIPPYPQLLNLDAGDWCTLLQVFLC